MKIKELLNDPSKWTQGANGRNKERNHISALDPNSICWCLWGAATVCYKTEMEKKQIHLKILNELKCISIIGWNDDEKRTFDDVKNLVEKLDI